MDLLRTDEMAAKYKAAINNGALDGGCVLCQKTSIVEFEYWKIIENDFPYDRIAKIHHMIVPKGHISEGKISDLAQKEIAEIKEGYISSNYNYIIEAAHKNKSIPDHFHLHLITVKD
jgi:diadenosine tetraphosphate (Ap4A) HIT family hydrolase